MSNSSSSKTNHLSASPEVESGSVEVRDNEPSALAGASIEINRCGTILSGLEGSSHIEGARATLAVDEKVIASRDDQSVASLPVESHATAETESISTGEMPADSAAVLPSEGRKIVTIEPAASVTRRRLSVGRALLVVAAEHQARVAASNGALWAVGQAHIDSPKSSKYGISLTAGLQALGIAQLQRGDLVQIEIGRGDTCYRVTGRASRKAAVYAAKTDLAQAGVELHTPFHYVVLGVVSESQVEGRQS